MQFLFSNQKDIFNSTYFKLLFYFFSAIIYSYFAGLSIPDDGLRHIAFAANPEIMRSWGDVFPHSLFYKEYDPWYIWHQIIRVYLQFFSYDNVHIAVNTTVLFMLMILLDKLLLRYSNTLKSPLIIFIILTIVLLGSFRYINMRPDLLSGIFLFSTLLLSRNIFILFIITVLYSTSYYLFFLYTGTAGLVYLVLKNYKAVGALFGASLIGLIFHLYLGGEYFVNTIIYLLTDQSLREGLEVGEGLPLFAFLGVFNYFVLVVIAWSFSALLIYKKYSYFKKQPIALIIVLMSPLWLAQARYFALLQPLILLYLFIEAKDILKLFFSRAIFYYILQFIHILKQVQYKTIFILPALVYTSFMFGYMLTSDDYSYKLQEKSYYKNEKFNNQTILLNSFSIEIYYALYLNPSLKFIPSCGIGWFEKNDKMKDIYIRMMKENGINEEELNLLLEYVDAKYYFHLLTNTKQLLSFEKLKKLGIVPILIIDNKILFEKKANNE